MIGFPETRGVYDHIIGHCAATRASMDIDAYWIDRVHRQKGWSKNGYHVFITRDGDVQWEGTGHPARRFGSPGAHVGGCGPGWNARSLGVCMAGGVKEDGRTPENNFTPIQMRVFSEVLRELVDVTGVPWDNVIGHRDLIKRTNAAPKACPCFSVPELVNTIRDGNPERTGPATEYRDRFRLSFLWDRNKRPETERGDKMAVRRQYIVKDGDTLYSISNTLGVLLSDLRSLNNMGPSDTLIRPGQRLRLLN